MTRTRLSIAALVSVAVLVAAGCGGGGKSSSSTSASDTVATVAGKPITRAQLDDVMALAEVSYKQNKKTFPKAGTAEYAALQQQAAASLVKQEEWTQEAAKLGITITSADVTKGVNDLVKTRFGGDQAKLDSYLKTTGYTLKQIQDYERNQLIETRLAKALTKDVTASAAEIKAYYDAHKSSSPYTTPAQRRVRHILVALNAKGVGVSEKGVTDTKVDFTKSKKLADQLYAKLKAGADFKTLVKKYSQDPGSKSSGGEYTDVKGTFVKEFEASAFALKTNEISKPVKSQFGYHLIQALADTKPGSTQSLAEATKGIRTILLQQKRQTALQTWDANLTKTYRSKVTYATGFAPPASTGTTTTS